MISFLSLFANVIPELSVIGGSFTSLSNSLLINIYVAYLFNSGVLFINCCVPALKATYSKDTSNLPIIPDCIVLDNWVFVNFILVDELFAKALWIF